MLSGESQQGLCLQAALQGPLASRFLSYLYPSSKRGPQGGSRSTHTMATDQLVMWPHLTCRRVLGQEGAGLDLGRAGGCPGVFLLLPQSS